MNGYFGNIEDPDEMPYILHFNSVYIVCKDKLDLQRKKNNFFL